VDFKIIGLSALAAVLIAGVAWAAWYALEHQPLELDARGCPPGPSRGGLVVVLDLTDAIDPAQMRRVRAEIARAVAGAPDWSEVAVGAVRPIAEGDGVAFSACKPLDGADASELTQNPRQIRARYEAAFLAPLGAVLDEMAVVQGADSSPIMETIQATISQAPGWAEASGQRRLLLVSDLLQHSDAFSLYRGGGWDAFRKTSGYDRLSRNLEDVSVDILRLPRPGARGPDPEAVDDFWAGYLDRQGARPPRIIVVGDL